MELKRNPKLLRLTQEIWSLLNPYNFKLLSKTIYLGFNKFVYSEIISAFYSDPTLAAINARKDVRIDLKGAKGITFWNFYDSVFELLDNNTKSTLVTEYERFGKTLYSKWEFSQWYRESNLHEKISSPPDTQQFYPWMNSILRQSIPSTTTRRPKTTQATSTHGRATTSFAATLKPEQREMFEHPSTKNHIARMHRIRF